MSWIRRLLSVFSMRSGSTRARLGYDAASSHRELDDWITAGGSANAEVKSGAATLRERSREALRNNSYASKEIESIVSNLIGTGINPRSAFSGDTDEEKRVAQKRNRQVDALWRRWSKSVDTSTGLGWSGVQSLVCRGWLESGEVLIRRRPRRLSDGLPVPLELQILEADLLDESIDGDDDRGRRRVQGVQFDGIERRIGYWLRPRHPGETSVTAINGFSSSLVAASDVAHLYRPTRPGQARGVPWLTPALMLLRNLDDYQNAQLVRAKVDACLAAFVITPDGESTGLVEQARDADGNVVTDDQGNPIDGFEPGMVVNLEAGKDVRIHSPTAVRDSDYVKQLLHAVAAGVSAPYEVVSQDLSQVNYSSIRAGLTEFRRLMKTLREQIFVPLFCARVWQWWVDMAIAAGELADGDYPVEWSEPLFESVDRLKDAQADVVEIRSGLRSLADVIASRGKDPDEVLRSISELNDVLDELGLIFDTDPRQVQRSGALQNPAGDANSKVDPAGKDGSEDGSEEADGDETFGAEKRPSTLRDLG